ncbi:Ferric uptake regulation protein FUR [Thermodesulfovibrio sp. N1]|jgi:Fur family ferric uptake transcriptional regulator|uniref:Fur family transcriptional regulator n=1 Tax=unclassified Thermodesulfovibrio TaxID=2645936 RepID=UPI00083A4900|nr:MULTISPECIES: transcriptional repressor [unclassified Thermodesulfovibrio]MDI1471978.1 transcriptional repressor [Thermodesulfovibrio sp. 1176]ODA43722.1 Ferric uptake regulation protein FUR [Thermodesulfovibrio sp. N1]
MSFGHGCGCKGRFKKWGLKWTQTRGAIIDILASKGGHLSAEEIFFEVKKILPGIGLATVYRTLEILCELGFVREFDFKDGRSRYEFIAGKEKVEHYHLVCKVCGKIIDYEIDTENTEDPLFDFKKSLIDKFNFSIERSDIKFFGICERCKNY